MPSDMTLNGGLTLGYSQTEATSQAFGQLSPWSALAASSTGGEVGRRQLG